MKLIIKRGKDTRVLLSIGIILYSIIFLAIVMLRNNNVENNILAFNNNEILVCYDTLIISNENWKLNGDHLYNHNSAGYINIKNCKIQ